MAERKFEVVRDDDEAETPSRAQEAGTAALLLGLKALSQRAIAAIADLFMLVTVASGWWLWASIPDPNDRQIVALTLYAAFVLGANYIVRRIR